MDNDGLLSAIVFGLVLAGSVGGKVAGLGIVKDGRGRGNEVRFPVALGGDGGALSAFSNGFGKLNDGRGREKDGRLSISEEGSVVIFGIVNDGLGS